MGCVNAYRRKLDAKKAQLLHKIMAGAIWTASMKFKANVAEEAKCPYCGDEGTVFHMWWACPVGAEARSTTIDADTARELPKCLGHRGCRQP